MNRFVTHAALCRAVLIGRLAVMAIVVGVTVAPDRDPWRTSNALFLVTLVTGVQLIVLTWHPDSLRRRLCALAVDAVLLVGLLLLAGTGITFFCYSAGFATLSGLLLGMNGLPLWVADTALGLVVAVQLVRTDTVAADRTLTAPFVIAFPVLNLIVGFGAAVIAASLLRRTDTAAAERAGAAAERVRLARELHDSVVKTLRGVSFAAQALPSALPAHPDVAAGLAATVSEGADAAARQARELVAALRRDRPDRPFVDSLGAVCRDHSTLTGLSVDFTAAPIEPPLGTRYELVQILHEALRNVELHARARTVTVSLRSVDSHVEMAIHDDGAGFAVPADLSALSMTGSFGIIGMVERARAVGGTLRIDSGGTGGTTVLVRVAMPVSAAGVADPVQIRTAV